MTLARKVVDLLLANGVTADVLARLDDLHRVLGPGAVEAFGALAERRGRAPERLEDADLEEIRAWLGRRFLERHHAGWLAAGPSPGFWRDRSVEGGATGLVTPLGCLESPGTALAAEVAAVLEASAETGAAPHRGILLLSRNAHFGNQTGSFAIDLVPTRLGEALALNDAAGRHHTIPGSVGEASGRTSPEGVALLWEIQPNVWKPSAARSPAARGPHRRYRGWPLAVTVAALAWLRRSGYATLILRGSGLAAAHEVDPSRPLSAEIAALHERTVNAAATALGLRLAPVGVAELPRDGPELAKLRLVEALAGPTADELLWRVDPASSGAASP